MLNVGVIGAPVSGLPEVFWPGSDDTGYKVGSIMFSPTNTDMPGFVKEFSEKYGQVWRRISRAEIEQRRRTTLWK